MKVGSAAAAVTFRPVGSAFGKILREVPRHRPAAAGIQATARLVPALKVVAAVPNPTPAPRAPRPDVAAGRPALQPHRGERLDASQIDQLCRELQSELGPAPLAANQDLPAPPIRLVTEARAEALKDAAARTHAAVELAQRIELFMKGPAPVLSLPLLATLGMRVDVERMGRGEVALTLRGRSGPPAPDAVARVREAVRSRGLRIGALTLA